MNIEEAIEVIDEYIRKQWSTLSHDAETMSALSTLVSRATSMQWQPIETAPDGVSFLAVINCGGDCVIHTMRRPIAIKKNLELEDGFIRERVTHWMPLPPLPEE